MPGNGTMDLKAELQNFGVSSRNTRLFGQHLSSDLLDYLDLLQPRSGDPSGARDVLPDGVAESQGRPLLFFVNETDLAQSPHEQQINVLRRKLACRGDRAYLARIRPGELSVVPVSLEERTPDWRVYNSGTPEAITFFTRLAHGHYDGEGEPNEADYVFSAMFRLVWSVANRLAELRLKRSDVLSVMGRALFFRFLKDRQVVCDKDSPRIAPRATAITDCFTTPENSAATSAWLDKTFNGNLLPLSARGNTSYFHEVGQRTGGRLFLHLSAIIRGDDPSGDSGYQATLPFYWGAYDFAHIPIGLLSQVYERFAWKWEHQNAKETSVHYTPRNIAATIIDDAFAKLPNAEKSRILDPACGAGVFLVLAFRRLYREHWKQTGQRPDTKAIRAILEKQLVGFDISDSALKLAALSLYLTAIELDPQPVPPEKLGFIDLRGSVLFNFRRHGIDPSQGPVAGSLADHVGNSFDRQFDLVVSNPPWTRLPKEEKSLARQFTALSKAIIARRGYPLIADEYCNPNHVPDLPFLWKATEWCVRGGRIALVLPARTLLKQEDIPRKARGAVFELLEVTGLLNGANLRKTEVWPDMDQPFILFFAKNHPRRPGRLLRLITPYTDVNLNGIGEIRIDTESADAVDPDATRSRPWLWKCLSIGTTLDADVVSKIEASGRRPLLDYWNDLGFVTSTGYQAKPLQEQRSAEALKVLPDIHSPKLEALSLPLPTFIVDAQRFNLFSHDTLCWPRTRTKGDELRVYRAPLVLVRAAPPKDRELGRALLSLDDVAYNESYYGYSSVPTEQGVLVARYLHLLVHSSMWLHYALATSAEIGVERPKFHKNDLDKFPVVPFASLSHQRQRDMIGLSTRLVAEDMLVFNDIDSFFAQVYGLNPLDLEVINDTLEVRDPNDELGLRASTRPTPQECSLFQHRLETLLRPFFQAIGQEPRVELWRPNGAFFQMAAPFGMLLISTAESHMRAPDRLFCDVLLKLADDTGCTQIIQQAQCGIVVGLLNQYRYWTPSRARLLAAKIVRAHFSIFEG